MPVVKLPGYRPGTFGEKIDQLSSQLEEFGEAHPQIRPLTRIAGRLGLRMVPNPEDPSSLLAPIGLTKIEAAQPFIKKLFKQLEEVTPPQFHSPAHREEIAKTLRLVGKGVPKKAVGELNEIEFDLANRFYEEPADKLNAAFFPGAKRIQLRPGGEFESTLPTAIGHEAGHLVTRRLLEKMKNVSELMKQSWFEMAHGHEQEGLAEYAGSAMKKKAGISDPPIFGYPKERGYRQQDVYEELEKMPSKNPYMNMYRYLQKQLRPESELIMPRPTSSTPELKKVISKWDEIVGPSTK
jgi:hypothetical protein